VELNITKTRTEQAKLDFAEALMGYNSTGIGRAMTAQYERHVKDMSSDRPSVDEIAPLMEASAPYRFGAFFEFHNHARLFRHLLSTIDRQKESVRAWLDSVNQPGALGSVTLDPKVEPPTYYRSIEIHTQPGNYHAEFGGVLYHSMIGPFLVHRDDHDEMGYALARGVPRRDYRTIVDLGCGVGKSTLPYCDLYPDAEVIGVDYAASMLKYGHKLAESRGKKVRYLQAHAEHTGLPDASADLVVAIWLFHELPRKARAAVVREALRILRPGGVFAIMESPPFKALREHYSPLSAFLLDSTGRRMSDPYIPEFFASDRVAMFQEGGFVNVCDVALPNELTGWGSGESYFFGAYPWWMTIGDKARLS
jgi:SAM-dependent methyltransferase